MIEQAKNKMVNQAPETKSETGLEQEFHFGGSGQFEPVTVIAHSIEEATEIWKKQRKEIKTLSEQERSEV